MPFLSRFFLGGVGNVLFFYTGFGLPPTLPPASARLSWGSPLSLLGGQLHREVQLFFSKRTSPHPLSSGGRRFETSPPLQPHCASGESLVLG